VTPGSTSVPLTLGSNPQKSRAYRFLESVATNNAVKEISIQRKINQLLTERENAKKKQRKIKYTIKEKYMQLESVENY
jgi:hypothetical protein